MKPTRRRLWIAAVILVVVAAFLVWAFAINGRRKVEQLKARLAAPGERLTLEDLGLTGGVPQDPGWTVLEAAVPYFDSLLEAKLDAVEAWQYQHLQAASPAVSWQQAALQSPRGEILDWAAATMTADRIQPKLVIVHAAMESVAPGG